MRKIIRWKDFLLEYNQVELLKYYIFDIDDNLLFIDTPIHFQHFEDGRWINKDVSTQQFAKIREEYPNNYMDNNEWKCDPKLSYIEFGDDGPRGVKAFFEDVKKSINNKRFGPSWSVFLNVLKEGRLFAIITTRAHETSTIRFVVQYIIDNVLSLDEQIQMKQNLLNFNNLFNTQINEDQLIENYLSQCYFIGLFSQTFKDEFNYIPAGEKLDQGKKDAVNKFVNYVREFANKLKKPLKVSFSDDDSQTTKELFMNKEKSLEFLENFYVFDTSNPKLKGGVKVKMKYLHFFDSLSFGNVDIFLNMTPWDFDQSENGWRSLINDEDQIKIIILYLEKYPNNELSTIMYFHLGQILAFMNKNQKAVKYMKKALEENDDEWNGYVILTIFFLQKNYDLFIKNYDNFFDKINQPNKQIINNMKNNFDRNYESVYFFL